MNYKRVFLLLIIFVWLAVPAISKEARLLRDPSISKDHVAFVYANDIWIVGRGGGAARQLTTHKGAEQNPMFSPDGRYVAFTGQYDGNTDVFVVPAAGGVPQRLTYHPYSDSVQGWTPDGSKVLFASGRDTAPMAFNRFWTVSVKGGMPEALPIPMGHKGAYSPDGKQLAYIRVSDPFNTWRHYRGGRTTEVWLFDFSDNNIVKVPRDNSNDTEPMWMGDTVYFLSDRDHVMNLFSYSVTGKTVKQLTIHNDYDIKSASCGDGVIIYEQAGFLFTFDPQGGRSTQLHINIHGDLPGRRHHFADVSRLVRSGDISPSGKRAVLSARGDIFTVPAKKGDTRNLTHSSGANDRFPAWSPDGKNIAWFSDAAGEYELKIADQKGLKPVRTITLDNPSFYYDPVWSPDSEKLLFADKRLNFWYVDVKTGTAKKIDRDTYDHPLRSLDYVWAPDSQWVAYSKRLDNHFHAIFVYSLKAGKSFQLTDGLSDAVSPAFDKSGKYLYFLASTNYDLSTGWLDMTSYEQIVTRGVYLVVLSSEEPSPLLPESDEEEEKKGEPEKKTDPSQEKSGKKAPDKKEQEKTAVRIDRPGIDQRILALDISERNYSLLKTGEEGIIFYAESIPNQRGLALHRYDLKKKESQPYMSGINDYILSADSKKMLYLTPGVMGIVDTKGKVKVGDGKLKTSDLRVKVDPAAEWKQIYREAWRINRDFLYDAEMHGADWKKIYKKYLPLLPYVAHRNDLNYILMNLVGELTIGHSWAGGGAYPQAERVSGGLLGADYAVENGFYRISKIYHGENWNPGLRAPLTEPGIKVSRGDYILAVNGLKLRSPANIYSLFEQTAGKQTSLRINDQPSFTGSRLVTVVPLSSERQLRSRAWIDENRRKVDKMSGGRLAYVYLPNTSYAGYINFNRYYFAQQHKQGAIIDERFNGGGSAADYFVDLMSRPLMSYWATRDGKEFTTPTAQIFGPKVMIINEYAGSGGDALPFYFRLRKLGPLVGKRTWGGLVGHHGGCDLIDGGAISSPNLAIYNIEGDWDVENIGVAPDIEVEMTPAEVIKGKDPQLERAVAEALMLLKENPVKHTPRPAPIDRVTKKKK